MQRGDQRAGGFFDQAEDVSIQGYNERHEVIYWNKASERLYGYTAEEALGRHLEDLIIPEAMRPRVRREIDNWLELGLPPFGGYLKLLHKDGSLVEVHSSHIITRGDDGRVTMYCIDLVAEQWTALPSIYHGGDDSAPSGGCSVYSCLSHEFRTPLNAIAGYSELLRQLGGGPLDAEDVEGLEIINRSAYRLLSSFDHLLFLLAWARGDARTKSEELSLFEILVEGIRRISDAAAIEGVTIHFSRDEEKGYRVRSDAAFLTQAIYAMLMAALYASKRGDRIAVELKEHAESDRLLVEVRDEGPPLEGASLCRIFTGQRNYAERFDPEQHGHVLFLPVAHDIAVHLGAMFTTEQLGEQGNRHLLSLIPAR